MFDIVTKKFLFDNPACWIDLCLSLLLIAGLFYVVYKLLNRRMVYIVYWIGSLFVLLAWFFGLSLVWTILFGIMLLFLIISITVNIAEVRPYLSNSLSEKTGLARGKEKIFDREAMYQKIETAVLYLSKNKTGAIITFEKNVELTDVIKSGTELHCPITPELLVTIFYPGTRLHDGAVVIRKEEILAASVYYTPTTKPLTGKFGSRHRAAIGISEITDSVTVIVSEETGRISLAVGGELIPTNPDTFLRTFEDYMMDDTNSVR